MRSKCDWIGHVPERLQVEESEVDSLCSECGECFKENTVVLVAKAMDNVETLCISCDPMADQPACLVVHISTGSLSAEGQERLESGV